MRKSNPDHRVARVGQADEGKVVAHPVLAEGVGPFWAENHDLSVARCKLVVELAQLRQVPSAIRSGEAAVEDE